MKIKYSRVIIFTTLVLPLFILSCSFVSMLNISANTATVSVRVPDSSKSYVRTIPSGGSVEIFSSHGGRYTITMIASEQYLDILNRLRSQIETRLFTERETLAPEDVSSLVENLNHIDKLLEQAKEPGSTCSGYVPDYETASVVISFDDFNNAWIVECGSPSGE